MEESEGRRMSLILSNLELKNCPFCGEKPLFTQDALPNGLWQYKIFCNNCNFCRKTDRGKELLVNQWNTRFDLREARYEE